MKQESLVPGPRDSGEFLAFYDYIRSSTLTPEDKEALLNGRITKVEISTSRGQWRIHLELKALVSKKGLLLLEEELCMTIDGLRKMEFVPVYQLEGKTLEDIMQAYWAEITFALAERIPALKGWLSSARWRMEDSHLYVIVHNAMGKELFESKKVDRFIADLILKEFNYRLPITVEIDESLVSSENIVQWQEAKEQEYINNIVDLSPPKSKAPAHANNGGTSSQGILLGKVIKGQEVLLKNVNDEEKNVVVQGRIFNYEVRTLKSGRKIITFNLTDLTDSLAVKIFEEEKSGFAESGVLKDGLWVKARGPVQYDKFSQELTLLAYDINQAEYWERQDNAPEKRVELHLHTKMSTLDGLTEAKELVKRAAAWGHEAIAITDHGVVQAFPEAHETGLKTGIKIIYGVEGYLVDDGTPIVVNPGKEEIDQVEYVIFDLETTGFSPLNHEIIEIGALRISGGQVIGEFSRFVKPNHSIPVEIQELTGITNQMVEDASVIDDILPEFVKFIAGAVLVAHNAPFDVGFIRSKMQKHLSQPLQNSYLDTLSLSRALIPKLKNYKLKTLTQELNIKLDNHHRAVDDAAATAEIFKILLQKLREASISNFEEINSLSKNIKLDLIRSHHVVILVSNQEGLKNLYELISLSHLKYFYRQPRIPHSELAKRRSGLLIGSACESGELIKAYLDGSNPEKLEAIAGFYDYLEIQPQSNNAFMVRKGLLQSFEEIRRMNKYIVQLGERLGKPVVATGDVHFLDPHDEEFRRILMSGKGFEDADEETKLYFKTTEEMLEEFAYLGPQKAKEVVIDNPKKIAAMIEVIKPIPKKFFPPKIEGAEDQINNMTYQRARELYGECLPEIVQKRIDKELNSIITNGFAVLYLIAHKLVKKSMDDGYLVGSRGSVGSSFVATMTGITEVNPLPPHYLCLHCLYSEFITDGSTACGADLPDKNCPNCGEKCHKEGHDIPFETFLGFEGDKVPDIDLNFSGEYQPRAHKYTEELFGQEYVFRAGTIATIASKTAFGFVKNYLEEKKLQRRSAEIARLVEGCTGVKRTTGQHPGGLMVVPQDQEIHNFTPVQRPADDPNSETITTHFDYHSIHDCLVKLDILGHDDPTVIKMLEDLTGVNARTIPLDEQATMKVFSSLDSLNLSPEDVGTTVGSFGIPEFGTKFVRQMLEDTRPTTFSELVRISGFSHGTDVWLNNAQDLIRAATAKLSEAISTRDDIMIYLIYKGLPSGKAFKIMEGVRKGKGVTAEDEELMINHQVPAWYIESCKKIKYMFPKAHAVAYVMMAFRIAYFKVYYPEAFYASYFTVRADDFDAELICQGQTFIKQKILEIEAKAHEASTKEKNLLTILEVALEMYARGIGIGRVDLQLSTAREFLIVPQGLLPPFGALQGVGENAARNIVTARGEKPYSSIEDLRVRAKLSKTVIEVMDKHGTLKGLSLSDQMALF